MVSAVYATGPAKTATATSAVTAHPDQRRPRTTAGPAMIIAAPTAPATTTTQRRAGFHEGVRSSNTQAQPAVDATDTAARIAIERACSNCIYISAILCCKA